MKTLILINRLSALLCLTAVLALIYFMAFLGLQPCPLCLVQQFSLGIITFFVLFRMVLASPYRPLFCWLSNSLIIVFSLFGAIMAMRQIWMQTHPDQYAGQCLLDVTTMIHTLPFSELLKTFFYGTPDCATTHWSLFGISMPVYSGLLFIAFLALHLYNMYFRLRNHHDLNNKDVSL